MQIAGVWDPYTLDNLPNDNAKKDLNTLLNELNLSDNYFSIRGTLVYVNNQKELVIKISSSQHQRNLKVIILNRY